MKNIIYGTGTYQKDFQYVFDDLTIEYYIDDEATEEIYPIEKIQEEKDYRVIVCKENSIEACQRLEKMGLSRGKEYVLAEDLFDNLNGDYYKSAKQLPDKLVVWGTGKLSNQFIKKFEEKEIDFFIDSKKEKEGLLHNGILIRTPESIKNWKEFFIVIAVNISDEIVEFLEARGLQRNQNYVTYNQISGAPSEMMKQVLEEKKLEYSFCKKPFEDIYVEVGGVIYLCCPYLIRDIDVGNLKEQEFVEIWNSAKAKIIRLSMIKRNFCFCEKTLCSNFLENQIDEKDYYDIKADEYPKNMMVSFDDSCNLKCPSCRKEYRFNQQSLAMQKAVDKCVEKLQPVVSKLELISIAGNGDPFYCKTYKKIWEEASYEEKKREAIRFQTNGLLLNEQTMEKILQGYKTVYIYVSIDAAQKKTYEKLRCGGKWETLKRNMKMVSEQRVAGKIKDLAISFVVQKDNYMEMKDFVYMGIDWNVDHIEFFRLADWNLYDKKTYMEMSMYDEEGKRKEELEEVLNDPIFKDPRVNLNNL